MKAIQTLGLVYLDAGDEPAVRECFENLLAMNSDTLAGYGWMIVATPRA